ncbi:uncharacterized protein C12orf56 [Aplysia californica]|uniref:Uncharacterized protein C12orf56 n=1 Tax=Aplysia californica TaxID=6500 RepID=A0ABM1A9G8_APLCA|nr:uncharacterized protein C12orf56 [Aplysia californica]
MAWGSGNAEIGKKNSKFESFLKRSISEEAFERVRGYESCIIVSEKENKAFKFVVLSDEWIYLTENPPKTLQEAVHLKDVTSVELVNEFPDFLTGSERTNTQHIAVSYVTTEPPRRRSLRRSRRSPRGSVTDLNADRSNTSTPLGYASSLDGTADEGGLVNLSLGSLQQSRPVSRGSAKGSLQAKKKKKPSGLNDSWDHDSILRSLKEEIEEDMLEDIEEDRLSIIRSGEPSRAVGRLAGSRLNTSNGDSFSNSGGGARPVPGLGNTSDSVSIRSSSQQSVRPLPPLPRTGAFETEAKPSFSEAEMQKLLGSTEVKEVEKVDSKGCCHFFKCCRGQKNQVAPICKNTLTKNNSESDHLDSKLDPLQQLQTGSSFGGSQLSTTLGGQPYSRNSSLKGSRSGTPLLEADRNINELNTSSTDLGRAASFMGFNTLSVDGMMERRKCVLNIYLLNLTSPFLMLLKSAWSNYVIRSTLALEPEHIEITTLPDAMSVQSSEQTWRDKIERRYNKMKRDLFQPGQGLETQFSLVDELLTAVQANFMLKKLFWRNPDVFSFMILQLQKFLPGSSAPLSTEEGKAQRADELEFVILLLSTINVMFRESETLPSRMQTLRLESGKMVTELLKILMCQPDIPYRPLTLTKHWSAPFAGSKQGASEKNLDEELSRLKTEYIRTAIASMFELFLVAKQASSDEMEILTITGMTTLFKEEKTAEKFVDRLLAQIMELVSLSRFDQLTPAHAIQVFQMFSLLLVFLEQNKAVVTHVRNHYYEEFKYFIQAPAVSRKLPVQYPITATAVSVIDQVVVKVLGNQSIRAS